MKLATSFAPILATALGSIGVRDFAEASGITAPQAPRNALNQPTIGTKIRIKLGNKVVTAT